MRRNEVVNVPLDERVPVVAILISNQVPVIVICFLLNTGMLVAHVRIRTYTPCTNAEEQREYECDAEHNFKSNRKPNREVLRKANGG